MNNNGLELTLDYYIRGGRALQWLTVLCQLTIRWGLSVWTSHVLPVCVENITSCTLKGKVVTKLPVCVIVRVNDYSFVYISTASSGTPQRIKQLQ